MENGNKKNGLRKFFTPGVIMHLIGWAAVIIFLFVSISAHTKDENVHMSYEKKILQFVTRGEYNQLKDHWNALVRDITAKYEGRLKGIEDELQSLNEYLRNTNK